MIDWWRVVRNLREKLTADQIAGEIGCSPSAVTQWSLLRYRVPRFDLAVKLLDLHSDVCAELHTMEKIRAINWR